MHIWYSHLNCYGKGTRAFNYCFRWIMRLFDYWILHYHNYLKKWCTLAKLLGWYIGVVLPQLSYVIDYDECWIIELKVY